MPPTSTRLQAIALARHFRARDTTGIDSVLSDPDTDLRDVATHLCTYLALALEQHPSGDPDAWLAKLAAAVAATER